MLTRNNHTKDRDRDQHYRRSIRLPGYDYTQAGAYFVTICTHNRQCLFGAIVNSEMLPNHAGRVAEACWLAIPNYFPRVKLDAYVIMPNHVHGIIVIADHDNGLNAGGHPESDLANTNVGAKYFSPLQPSTAARQPPPHRQRGTSQTIGSIIRGFKIGVTKWFRANTEIYTVWQRNYYEHIIRNDISLQRIRQYIADNPLQWNMDRENPDTIAIDTDRNNIRPQSACRQDRKR